MIRSYYEIDTELGLWWYLSDAPGTGGVLRTESGDFTVEEIADHQFGEGPYLICRMTKNNWDQHRAIKAVASGLGISHQRIGFAGTKDKRAVTTQYISLYKITKEQINTLTIPGIQLDPVGFMQHPIKLGQLSGNRFSIRIRGINESGIEKLDDVSHTISKGVPNYVGYQRFGVTRPVTHCIGFEILKGNFQEAIRVMIGKPGSSMEETEKEARLHYSDTEDPAETLHLFPVRLSLERSVLHYLVSNPGDYLGALQTLPRTLRSMYVSAVQSWIFNHSLSMRIQDGRALDTPDVGDRLIWPDGRTDVVTSGTMRAASVQVKRDKCSIALMLPGGKYIPADGEDEKNIASLMDSCGITSVMFENMSSILETAFAGSFRSIVQKTDLTWTGHENGLDISFMLPPGQYATTVLREIMKTDPLSMV